MKRVLPAVLSMAAFLAAIWAIRLNMLPAADAAERVSIPTSIAQEVYDPEAVHLPAYRSAPKSAMLARSVEIRTIQPTRARIDILRYTVQPGDSVFGIADKFTIKPETVLWGNYETLNDDPHLLRPGQELNILPVDGTYYQWQAGDSLSKVADFFGVGEEDISSWPGNKLDPSNPELKPGDWVIVPGGQ